MNWGGCQGAKLSRLWRGRKQRENLTLGETTGGTGAPLDDLSFRRRRRGCYGSGASPSPESVIHDDDFLRSVGQLSRRN